MPSVMEEIEKKYPKLINCFGCLHAGCETECDFIYECLLFKRVLSHEEFLEGKYREGFGRKKLERKRKGYRNVI